MAADDVGALHAVEQFQPTPSPPPNTTARDHLMTKLDRFVADTAVTPFVLQIDKEPLCNVHLDAAPRVEATSDAMDKLFKNRVSDCC